MAFLTTVLLATAYILLCFTPAASSCVQTTTTCQCARKSPSKKCFFPLGDGTCQPGACDNGFQCACSGYHLCSLSKCKTYEAAEGASPNGMNPFKCQMTAEMRNCVLPFNFTNSIPGAENAVADAMISYNSVSSAALYIVDDLKAIQRMQNTIDVLLVEVEKVGEFVPDEELSMLYDFAFAVDDSANAVAVMVSEAVRDAASGSTALKLAHRSLRFAKQAFKNEMVGRKELQLEKENSTVETAIIERLEASIRNLRQQKWDAAENAASSAGNLHSTMRRSLQRVDRSQEMKENAEKESTAAVKMAQQVVDQAKRQIRQ